MTSLCLTWYCQYAQVFVLILNIFLLERKFQIWNVGVLCCVYLIAPVCSCFLWSPGEFLLLQSVKLTAARWLLAQLQSIDGQPVGSPAQVAFLSFTFHIAFALRSIGRLDLVTTVAFCPELQTCKHVTSGGKRKEKGLASLVNEGREVGAIALLCVLIIHWAK